METNLLILAGLIVGFAIGWIAATMHAAKVILRHHLAKMGAD